MSARHQAIQNFTSLLMGLVDTVSTSHISSVLDEFHGDFAENLGGGHLPQWPSWIRRRWEVRRVIRSKLWLPCVIRSLALIIKRQQQLIMWKKKHYKHLGNQAVKKHLSTVWSFLRPRKQADLLERADFCRWMLVSWVMAMNELDLHKFENWPFTT